MKKIKLIVEIEVEDHLNSDGDIAELTSNVLDAIVFAADHEGIVPEESETYTRKITVSNNITNSWYSKDLIKNVNEQKSEILYVLSKNAINGIELDEDIQDNEFFEYKIIERKDFIETLFDWISEAKSTDMELMKDDLTLLLDVKDEYILSSINTNSYLYEGCSEFNENCEELLKLNEFVK